MATWTRKRLKLKSLDGPAIRNANWGDSHESIRTNRFAEKSYFHSVRAIRANRLKPSSHFLAPPGRDSQKKKGVQFREPWNDSRESGDSRESANSRESGHLSSRGYLLTLTFERTQTSDVCQNAPSLEQLLSRLSFPARGPAPLPPPHPGTGFKAPGSLTQHRFDTFLKGFRRVLEGVLKGF